MNPETVLKQIHNDPYNPMLYLALARAYLDQGEERKASDVVVARRRIPSDNPEVHLGWAELCEEMGMAGQARESYKSALRASPDNVEVLYRYARLLNDTGYYEDSIRYLKKAVRMCPDHIEAKKLLSDNYLAIGLDGLAEVLYPSKEKPQQPVRYFPPSIGKQDATRFLSLFSGREVGHALQTVYQKTGDVSYEFVEAPLSEDLVVKHITGHLTLAGYPLRTDMTIKYSNVEIRLAKRVIEANIKNRGYLKFLNEKALHHSVGLRQLAAQHGIPAYLECPGESKYRLWFFFREFNHFLKVKDFLKRFLEDAHEADPNFVIEPVQGTRGVGIGWVEHPVLLPLGINRATLKRALFLGEEGDPLPEQLKFLKKIREIPFEEAAKRLRKAPALSLRDPQAGLSEKVAKMIRSCPVVNELYEKARRGRMLSRQEKVILFYTVGIVDADGLSIHRTLEPCPDYAYHSVENQRVRLKPNPISCLKIREWIPEVTASLSCNCSFDLRAGKYPSPVLHVNPHLVPSAVDFDIPDGMPAREAARRYVNLKKQAAEIERAMGRLAAILDAYSTRKGIREIRAGDSLLVRGEGHGANCWEIEVKK